VFPRGSALPVRSGRPWSAARPPSPRVAVESAGRKGPGSRLHGARGKLWRGAKAQESNGPRRFGAVGYGSSRGAKPWSCGASWPSGPQSRRTRCQKRQEGNGAERRTAPRGGNTLQGEPHEWHRSFGTGRRWREEAVKRVGNPEGGTNRVWKPGYVDLHAHVAVGAPKPRRVVGAARLRRGWYGEP